MYLLNKIGGTYTKPLLLPPEVVIVGLGRIQVYTVQFCTRFLLISNNYIKNLGTAVTVQSPHDTTSVTIFFKSYHNDTLIMLVMQATQLFCRYTSRFYLPISFHR